MADSSGIAALMKALNDSPSLGSGLKPAPVARAGAAARTSAASGPTSLSSAARSLRATSVSATATTTAKPKILQAEGQGYDPKAPRGTYLNLLI